MYDSTRLIHIWKLVARSWIPSVLLYEQALSSAAIDPLL